MSKQKCFGIFLKKVYTIFMHWISWVFLGFGVVGIVNLLLLIGMVFLEKKKPQTIMAWMAILTFLPIIGFVFYMLLGSGLSHRVKSMIKKKAISEKDVLKNIKGLKTFSEVIGLKVLSRDAELVKLCFDMGGYPCIGNDVKIFCHGMEKMAILKQDLLEAKKSINLEYYIFANDKIGKEIMGILIKKAKDGVKVKLIYDSIGSKKSSRRFFKKLEKAGGEVAEFFPPFLHVRWINMKVNYRNHRKIAVIDGKIAYTGGINIRDDHMGMKKKLSPWRDASIRIEGSGVYPLQNIFLDDWRYAKKDETPVEKYLKFYFPVPEPKGDVALQVLTSGPDSELQKIKEAYIKMIVSAKKRVYLQTPYFVPDDAFMSALTIAKKSGVDVRIMLPAKPDKRAVYLPTLSYAREMAEVGIKIYFYNGFLHAKTLLVDDNKLSIGSCNLDNRSFGLNFECTAIMYSEELTKKYLEFLEEDFMDSVVADEAYFKKIPLLTKMGQAFYRMLSPLL